METLNNKNTGIIIALVAIIVGVIIGYAAAPGRSFDRDDRESMMNRGGMMAERDDMTTMMHGMNAGLEGKTGDEFDKAFLSEMIVHHQGAVSMAEQALKSAKHQEVKDLAAAIIVAQKKEIADMEAWEKAWYGR